VSGSELTFTATRTKADYFWAIAFNALRSPIVPIVFAVALLFVLVPNVLENGGLRPSDLGVLAGLFAAIVALYYVALLVAVWFTARRNWSAPGALSPLSYTFSSEGIAASYELAHGKTTWPLWRSAMETKGLILICHTLGPIHIIPKRDLDRAIVLRLRALLREHLGARARLNAKEI
jgi:hypothetical protein